MSRLAEPSRAGTCTFMIYMGIMNIGASGGAYNGSKTVPRDILVLFAKLKLFYDACIFTFHSNNFS